MNHSYVESNDLRFAVLDCVSLYPSTSHLPFPIGPFQIISCLATLRQITFCQQSKQHYLHGKKLIGIAQANLLAPESLFIPFIGIPHKKEYWYGNCTACIKKKNTKKCRHHEKNRAILATLTWEEINFCKDSKKN